MTVQAIDLITPEDAVAVLDHLLRVLRAFHAYEDTFEAWDGEGNVIREEADRETWRRSDRELNEAEQEATIWLARRFGLNAYDHPVTLYLDDGELGLL